MKKLVLTLILAASASAAFGQTISATGTSGQINPGGTFDSTITLTIQGANSIGSVQSLNLLLATPSTGIHSGAGLFTVFVQSLTSPFDNKNSGSASGNQSSFATAGDAANSGNTVSTTSLDLGANTSTPVSVASSGTTNIQVDLLRFTAAANVAPGTYNFFATSGGSADAQGTFIGTGSQQLIGTNSAPVFTLTVVPEPSTWLLMVVGGLGVLGFQFLRARRHA